MRGTVLRKGHILIVEPDDLIRELLERWLGEAGYATVSRELPNVAGTRWRDGVPQLIIADVPGARHAASLIQALQEVYPVPVVLLSARFRRGLGTSREAARRLGVKTLLPKPFTRKELLDAVRASAGQD